MRNYQVKNGVIDGPLTLYNKHNQLLLKCNFINGKLEGSFERYVVSREEITLNISCNRLNRLFSKRPYKLIHSLNFKDDKLHGQCNLYNSNHALVGSGLFQNGNPIGIHNFYHHGVNQPYYTLTFDNGTLKEPIVYFDYKGQIIENISSKEERIINWIEKKQYLRWYSQIISNEIAIHNNDSTSWRDFNNDVEINELKKYSKTLNELFLNL